MTTRPFSITAAETEKGKRLDKALTLHISGFSRSVLQKAIEAGQITVNGKKTEKDYALKIGDVVSGVLELPEEPSIEPDPSVPFAVVHDAPGFAVIDKPAGVVVHPSYTHKKGTLVNGLVARWPEIKGVGEHSFRPGIVHRLGKETSGAMGVAKTDEEVQCRQKIRCAGVWRHEANRGRDHRPHRAGRDQAGHRFWLNQALYGKR